MPILAIFKANLIGIDLFLFILVDFWIKNLRLVSFCAQNEILGAKCYKQRPEKHLKKAPKKTATLLYKQRPKKTSRARNFMHTKSVYFPEKRPVAWSRIFPVPRGTGLRASISDDFGQKSGIPGWVVNLRRKISSKFFFFEFLLIFGQTSERTNKFALNFSSGKI